MFLPGDSQGRGSLVGCGLWGHTESDTTEQLNWTELITLWFTKRAVVKSSRVTLIEEASALPPHIYSLPHYQHSVQFSCLVMSDTLHARPPCPSPNPGVYSNLHPLSQWCHPTISSYVVPFSSCLQSFSASGSFKMSQFLTSGGQSIGDSASTSVFLMHIQDWFPLGWTGWISFQFKGLLIVFSWRSSTLVNHIDTSSPTVHSLH